MFYADINSSYPYIMTLDMPCGELHEFSYEFRLLPEIDYETKYNLYRVKAFVFSTEATPMLPTVSLDGTLIYPSTWSHLQHRTLTKGSPDHLLFWGVELRAAIARGCKIWVDGHFEWDHREPLFRNFIEKVYAERLQAKARGDAAMVQATKLVMNSLSGKLGQRTFDRTVLLAKAHIK